MRFLEYLEYAVSPTTKLLICAAIALALFIVYLWKPSEKKPPIKMNNEGFMSYVEIDPQSLAKGAEWLEPSQDCERLSSYNATLQQLDEYVKSVREYHIKSLDEV